MNSRISRLNNKMQEHGWIGTIIYSPENRYYFSKYRGTAGMLVIQPESRKLITDFRYIDQARSQSPDFEVIEHQQNMVELVCSQFSNCSDGIVGLEFGAIPTSIYLEVKERLPQIKFVDCSTVTNAIRSIKDEEEIANIAKGIAICDQAFAHILNFIEPGKTEKEIGLELEIFMKRAGAEGIKANHVIASGPRASLPHGQATDRVLQEGDFLKMDYGAVVNRYISDFTRTVVLGPPSEKQLEIYNIVKKAQEESLKVIGPGVKCCDVDHVGRSIITEAGYGPNFGHSLGHSLGLFIHESPALRSTDQTILQPGMVITVEPGIYISGFGGVRIEDLLVITKDGYKNLTTATKELQIIQCKGERVH